MLVTDSRMGIIYDDQTGEIYKGTSSQNRGAPSPTGQFMPRTGTIAPAQIASSNSSDLLNFGNSQDPGIQLFKKIYGTNPSGYSSQFNQAYANLGQNPQGHDAVAANGILSLAKPYIDRYIQKNGKLPSEDEVQQFVAENLTPGYAREVILGNNYDQVISKYVDPALQQSDLQKGSGQSQDQSDITKGIEGMNALNEKLFQAAKEQTGRDVEEAYIPQKRSLVEDLAAQNQLGQANSRYSLDALEAAKNKAMTSALGNLAVARAQGGLDIAKTAQNLLANQRGLNQQAKQFGLTYGLDRQRLNQQLEQREYERGLQQQQVGLASQLGRRQAEASKPGWLDYLGLGFQGLGAIGGLASGLGQLKTAYR